MYEYICSNKGCNEVWTIREGDIGTLYLTCPVCKKGIGRYLRQIKEGSEFKKITKKTNFGSSERIDSKIKTAEVSQVENVEKTIEKLETKEKNDIKDNHKKDKHKEHKQIKNNKSEEENIFDRIIKKRQQEQEFVKDIEENVDILEINGNSVAEIEKRIKEFEEFYYIKVIDTNIVQNGDRYNCILKYKRK